MKKIAVLLASYNGEKYIEEQLDSLNRQTYQNFICFIHDDGSTDATNQIIDKYCKEYPDKFKKIIAPGTGGAKYNFMFLLNHVDQSFDYYMFCDQDDVWLPTKIKKTLDFMESTNKNVESPCLVYCDMKVVNQDLDVVDESFLKYNHLDTDKITLDRAIMKPFAAGCSMMINKSLANMSHICNAENIVMHDWWLMIIAASSGSIKKIPESLSLYRQHGNNTLGAQKITTMSKVAERLKRIVTFQQVKVTKNGFAIRMNQLSECKNIEKVYGQNKELIDFSLNYKNCSKIKKCKLIVKYGLYQNTWSKFWTCLWV